MSQKGINIAAEAFTVMQTARMKLLELGCESPRTPEGQQDILLGHLFERANDAVKEDFMRILAGKLPTGRA